MSEEKKDELQPKVEEEVKVEDQPKVEEEPKVEEPVKDEQPKVEETKEEETPAPVENTEDTPIVIDNTAEPPVQPIQDLPRTAKLKEPMSKNKKIAIVVISVIAFIAIFSVVFFPLYFCYFQGRIHIYNGEDFVEAASAASSSKRFVLEKDIVVTQDLNLAGSTSSIDLNGHNLTVEGTLYIGAPDATINVGTLKKGQYTEKGLVTVNGLVVSGKDTNFASAVISKGSVKVTANNVVFNTISAVDEAFFNVNAITFNGAISVSSEATSFVFKDCKSVVFGAEVNGNSVSFESSNIVLNKPAVGHNFILDDLSTLKAYGKLDSVTGGKKVAMLQGHSCASYTNVQLLAIYNPSEDTYTATNIGKLVYVETLPAPVDLMVSEEGGVFRAICAKVNSYAGVKYQFTLDDKKYDATENNFVDITADLKSAGAATHTVKAAVIGNFDYDTLNAENLVSGQTLYLDCETPTSIEYSYTLKLSTPTNVDMVVYDGNVYLSFAAVDFADYYVVTIDGTTKYVLTIDSPEKFIAEHASVANEYGNKVIQAQALYGQYGAALTEQLSALGYHSLRLVACSFSKEIETSKETMTSYKTEKQINLIEENITATATRNSDGTYTNTITIANCEDGKIFKIVIGGKEVRISNTTYTFTSETSLVGTDVEVTAEAYGYYLASVARVVKIAEIL